MKSHHEINEQFHAPAENYQIINDKQKLAGGERWTNDEVLSEYRTLTDRMIAILDGSAPQGLSHIEENGRKINAYRHPEKNWAPDNVVWLAKSAVPVSALVDAFWEQDAHKDAVKPRDEYLKIDRRDYLGFMGYDNPYDQDSNETKTIDVDKIPSEFISRLRAYFVEGDIDMDNWEEDVWNKPTRLDGKRILVVDEVKNSGASLEVAMKMIKRAIPKADVSGTYFWAKEGSVPIWYPPKAPGESAPDYGRMVSDPNPEWWDQFPDDRENRKRKLAAFILPTPFHDRKTLQPKRDEMSDMLAQDIAYMTYDAADRKILNKAATREDDDWERILTEQGLSPEEFIAWKKAGGFKKKK